MGEAGGFFTLLLRLQFRAPLAGLFDLTGEGRDNIEEFMRTLRKEGTVIDAYLDLKDLTVKGDSFIAFVTSIFTSTPISVAAACSPASMG